MVFDAVVTPVKDARVDTYYFQYSLLDRVVWMVQDVLVHGHVTLHRMRS